MKGEEWRPVGSYCRNKSWKWGLLEIRGLQGCFCERPSSQYFRFCRPGSLLLLVSSALPGCPVDPMEAGPQHCVDSRGRVPLARPGAQTLLLEPLAPGGSEHFCLCGFYLSLFPVFELKRRNLRYLLFHFKVVTSLMRGNKTSSMKSNFLKQAKVLERRRASCFTLWTLRRGRQTAGSTVSRSCLAEVCGGDLAPRSMSAGGGRSDQPFRGVRVRSSAAQPGARRRPGIGGAR